MTTDGATRDKNNGFVALCKNNYDFIHFFSFHCVGRYCIRVVLYNRYLHYVLKIVNSNVREV